MGANLPFYMVTNLLLLRVLPALEHKFEAVAVGIEYICRVVPWVIVNPCTGRAIVGSARRNRRCVGSINLCLRRGQKADMDRLALDDVLS